MGITQDLNVTGHDRKSDPDCTMEDLKKVDSIICSLIPPRIFLILEPRSNPHPDYSVFSPFSTSFSTMASPSTATPYRSNIPS